MSSKVDVGRYFKPNREIINICAAYRTHRNMWASFPVLSKENVCGPYAEHFFIITFFRLKLLLISDLKTNCASLIMVGKLTGI